MTRAVLWLVAVAAVAAGLVLTASDLALFARRAADPKLMLELAGTLLTGILAVVAAFHLALPDRPRRWALLPLPSFLLWLGSSGYSCWRHWVTIGPDGWVVGESAECFAFILAVSVPLSVALVVALRRARPLMPLSTALVGGLGVASLAAFLLQFFHPFDVTVMDLGLHLAAVALVASLMGAGGTQALRSA
jgi:hypothetical protein